MMSLMVLDLKRTELMQKRPELAHNLEKDTNCLFKIGGDVIFTFVGSVGRLAVSN